MGIRRTYFSSFTFKIFLLLSTTTQWIVSRSSNNRFQHFYFLSLSFRCNELQTLLDRMKPINGSMVSLYEQVEEHVRPWLKILDGINDSTTKTSTASISLYKLKQSLEKLFLEQNWSMKMKIKSSCRDRSLTRHWTDRPNYRLTSWQMRQIWNMSRKQKSFFIRYFFEQ